MHHTPETMNPARMPAFNVDRRQWLKSTTVVLAGGILTSRWLRAVESTAASPAVPETLSPETASQTDRRYLHGFEAEPWAATGGPC